MATIDVVGALIAQTRLKPATVALCGGRISGGRPRTRSPNDPNGWQMPTSAVVFAKVAGPAMRRYDRIPFRSTCIQADFFGTDLRAASALYEQWYQDFFPYNLNTPSGFIAAHTAIASVEQLGSSVALYDQETAWPRVTVTLMLRHSEIPTP